MPFIRYTRDKRGYEHTYVMHAYRPGHGPSRARVLYLFRSPSSLRIGRRPLDPEVTEALEHTHPDLSFDWPSLVSEPETPRVEPRDRDRRPASRPTAARDRSPDRAPTIVEDESVLGRTLGAQAAARLRVRYDELLQRINRRARTPEDRDRLTERARRLNPDDWADEPAVRAGAASIEAAWEAIAGELPQRHRGRRGGRHRGPGQRQADLTSVAPPVPIIDRDEEEEDASHAPESRVDDLDGDGDRVGAGDRAAAPAATHGSADDPGAPAGGDVPGGD